MTNLISYRDRAVMETEMGEGMTELVRGQEAKLLERLEPVVRRQSVMLDMSHVERIDAAGIAALIRLYCLASEAGHTFSIAHPSARVEEILHLVGVERILATKSEEDAPEAGLRLELTAA